MLKYILIITLLFSLIGCDNRTTDPEDDIWSRVQVFFTNNLVYEEVLDVADDSTMVTVNLPDDSECQLDKYYFETQTTPQSDIYYSYRVIAKKFGFYSTYQECGKQDTIYVNASGGFAQVVPGLVCGTFIDIFFGPLASEELYILQDSVIVDSLTTTVNGYFAHDIELGNYQMAIKAHYPDDMIYDFVIDSFYRDYYIILMIAY